MRPSYTTHELLRATLWWKAVAVLTCLVWVCVPFNWYSIIVFFFEFSAMLCGDTLNRPSANRVLMTLSYVGALAVLTWFERPRRQRRVIIRYRLDRGICGGCRYPLRDIPTADDRLTQCPECGASWLVPSQSFT